MTTALCPGSFDPPTSGHVDVIERTIAAFDRVIVSVVDNPAKKSLFSTAERIELLEGLFGERVDVVSFSGLLVDHVQDQGADVVVKGLRSIDDYEYEKQMSQMNRHLTGMETVYMATAAGLSFISSSLVKEVAKLGGDVSQLVPSRVATALKEKYE
ncbi:MAG: pantetheine-phosphate adenylyltransferase [Acidimicrobiia bacterium]|nr:pantetheine-phosphate adenylyltransferase [Acidimicrobiia bacterium]